MEFSRYGYRSPSLQWLISLNLKEFKAAKLFCYSPFARTKSALLGRKKCCKPRGFLNQEVSQALTHKLTRRLVKALISHLVLISLFMSNIIVITATTFYLEEYVRLSQSFSFVIPNSIDTNDVLPRGLAGQLISKVDSVSSDTGSNPGRGRCFVIATWGPVQCRGNPPIDYHHIQKGVEHRAKDL